MLLEQYAIALVPHAPFLLDRLTAPARSRDEAGVVLGLGGVAYGVYTIWPYIKPMLGSPAKTPAPAGPPIPINSPAPLSGTGAGQEWQIPLLASQPGLDPGTEWEIPLSMAGQ